MTSEAELPVPPAKYTVYFNDSVIFAQTTLNGLDPFGFSVIHEDDEYVIPWTSIRYLVKIPQ